jgi:curli biogenesis system outer membrane secretion channel CsgG
MADLQIKIAVLPFDDGSIQNRWWGNEYVLGNEISDELVTALLQTNRFKLIEREQVQRILDEQKFGATGLVDAQSAAEIGKLIGAQYLVMGRVTEFSNNTQKSSFGNGKKGFALSVSTAKVAIDARLVDTTSAEIITSVTGVGEKKNTNLGLGTDRGVMMFGSSQFRKSDLGKALRDAVTSVAGQLATKVYDGSTINLTLSGLVAYASPDRIIINLGTKDGVEQGMVFVVTHKIQDVMDPTDPTIVIDEISEPIAEITVSDVKEKTATCSLTNPLNPNYKITINDKVKSKSTPAGN